MLNFPKEENMKAINYTPEMEQAIREEAPLNIAKARQLANELGKKPRSVIAKAISMGLPYEAAKPTRKNGSPVARKADYVRAIEKALSSGEGALVGLEKATASALEMLLSEIA
jgi:hypothetical protein